MSVISRFKKMGLRVLCVGVLLGLSISVAQATETKLASKKFSVMDHGKEFKFRMEYGENDNHQFQVTVYFRQNRGLYYKERPVFYGRDLDGDHYPETWFVRQDIFIYQVITYHRTDLSPANDRGEDAIEHLVNRIVTLKKDSYFTELWMQFGNFATSTVANMNAAKEEFVQNELDLTSLQYQIHYRKAKLAPNEPVPAELDRMQALVEQGYDQNLKHLDQALNGDYNRSAIIETVVDVTMIKVGELVVRGGSWIARSMGRMSRAARVAETFEAFVERFKTKIGLGAKAEAAVDSAGLRTIFGLSYKGVMAETRASLKALAARNVVADKVLGALSTVGKTYYRGAVTNFKYLLQTQALQVLAEAYDKRAEIYDPNPIIMTKKLFSNVDFLQDFAFMCNESMLQGGIAAGPGSLKRRFMAAGVVSLFDSGVMNIAIKGEADPKRIGMDTGWEMLIGNAQTQLDVASLKYFEKMAIKNKNPKLKLVGYAIALVDQFAGYIAYSKASTAVSKSKEEKPKPQVKLIPILAEVGP